ncbi:hypothetical protein KEM48_007382 [Puccinia striiformis f. sp. tritici PST-130]|uniref:Uncharacterized protein n=2 Tax=Puccinia striiformis f. sp. tritici TaxID=168172 RepID=A0A0L0UU87_9BASI|nr:hypothetical protein KEM48_007382 [Puccinia striiformis f. sp. tritici PST-130]KNE90324.1 hypothetical protein PSTG_16228 [Puccinia striiformis f. sp. tritici PST-78]
MTDQDAANTIELPPLTPIILRACSFQNWYTTFSQYTFQSTIITLDQAFIEYLRDNCHGLHLPEDLTPVSTYTSQLSDSEDGNDIGEVSPTGSPSSSRSSSPPPRYSFPELTKSITETIEMYGGSVFPKLNWSAPQDAGFLLVSGDGPLRCRSAMDVYMLLKGSDCIFHDLDVHEKIPQASSDSPLPVVLVLREWFNLNPAHEFRCFVRDRKLIAISARSSTHYDFLLPEEVRQSIVGRIGRFFDSVIIPEFHLPDFIFDVYLKNPTKIASSTSSSTPIKPNLKLVDINPYATYIDPCLFSYEELEQSLSITTTSCATVDQTHLTHIVKLVESEHPHQNFRASKFQTSKLPAEFINFSQNQGVEQLSDEFKRMLDSETR